MLDRRDFSRLLEVDTSFEREFVARTDGGYSAERALEFIKEIKVHIVSTDYR